MDRPSKLRAVHALTTSQKYLNLIKKDKNLNVHCARSKFASAGLLTSLAFMFIYCKIITYTLGTAVHRLEIICPFISLNTHNFEKCFNK